jgi:prepilin-type processing-associated H-X9-DG protein
VFSGTDFSRVIREATRDLLLNSFFFGVSLVFLLPGLSDIRNTADDIIITAERNMECARRLEKLGAVLRHYATDNHHWYPDPQQWCDLLIEYGEVKKDDFVCPAATTAECHYAINPYAVPLSRFENRSNYWDAYGLDPLNMNEEMDKKTREKLFQKEIDDMMFQRKIGPSVVLLFECESGWNQNGGDELLSTKHHQGKGCNILFNDGHVKFISTDQFCKLRWGNEQKPQDFVADSNQVKTK